MDSSMNEIIMELVRAFLVGGIICALVQVLLDRTKMMPGRVMVALVVTGNILGWLGLYEPFLKWAGAGAGGAAPRLWQYSVDGSSKSSGRGRTHWDFQRRPDSRLCRDRRGAGCSDIWGHWCLSQR